MIQKQRDLPMDNEDAFQNKDDDVYRRQVTRILKLVHGA